MSITLSLVKNLSRLNENRAKAHIAIENGFGRKGRFTPRGLLIQVFICNSARTSNKKPTYN